MSHLTLASPVYALNGIIVLQIKVSLPFQPPLCLYSLYNYKLAPQ